ncbi:MULTISPECIES: carboxylate/amino acid/amine transporter [Pseudoalteromonas]|jgi:carboxylate/amino acid/amine transporter|uniref:Membrane protein n=1 Tax=Pseudoalteromonas translucida (strain TAC 125) TaxID=326442 RepID=Q3IEU2_PSET1|nr:MULTISPECIES: carboxylate/amino acid/amine transporter [Pseudoalteromonas]MBB1371510.1 DMT family transporter [Pseudoalteromonas sp. SR45-4]MBB1406884.1 DMT family transporter [Pseudoalteromonas sp. SG44-5]MBH0071397.1 DMT family transporter [Pseudoalteromonas sp. NZS127]MBH0093092.1 DMT family transporter [Pseudoalteromonas sp. SCQQ13]WMS93709.1 carboxylate/amino acid/amine transporter [Pseudoalteromonas sp. HL-AS2]|tara:strand:- start:33696 stop:34550 length:855 start_codon:yes stop_codon:yes gene_type:complete
MAYLFAVTLLWAFSFSLIGVYLAGQVDAWFSVLIRIALAALIFLPFLKVKQTPKPLALKLMLIGAVQLGAMYSFYYHSFLYLSVPEVLLFTVMTPLYITLLNDALEKHFNPRFFIVAIIAIGGAVAIRYEGISSDFLLGLLLVQAANLCFAIGQVAYKRLMSNSTLEHKSVFGWFFIGALCVALVCYLLFGNTDKLPTTTTQWSVLIYLGIVASGFGYFVWNKGATLVNVGALAVMNNLLIPAGIIVNVLIWNRDADLFRLAIGAGIILAALLVNQYFNKSAIK